MRYALMAIALAALSIAQPIGASAQYRNPSNTYEGGAPAQNGAGQLPGERTQCRTGCSGGN